MTKKQYIRPVVEIVRINACQRLLAGSVLGNPETPGIGAPEMSAEELLFGSDSDLPAMSMPR